MISNITNKGIKKEYFFVVMISLLLIICNSILWLILSNFLIPLSDAIVILLIISIIPSYFFMLFSTRKYFGFARFYFVFLVLTVFFYYGQHILVILDYNYLISQDFTILDGRISNQSILNASFLIIQSLLLIHIGYFSGIKSKWDENILRETKDYIDKRVHTSFKIIAWTLFIVSGIAMLIKLSYLIQLNQSYGYLERRALEASNGFTEGLGSFALYLSEWFFPSIYMLFIFNTGKLKNKAMYLIIGVFSILYLMSGSRFLLLKLGMGIFLIQFIWIRPLTKKTLRRILILGIVGVIVLKIISLSRAIPNAGLSSISDIFNGLMSEGIFSGVLWETGITFTSVSNVLDKVPSLIPHFGGKSYLGSILIFLPSFMRFGFFSQYNISVSATFSPLYYNTNLIGYGSSFIAEAFYNLGYLVLPFMFLIGLLFAKTENLLMKAKITKNPPLFFISTYILSELIYIVRNDMYPILRYVIFYAVVPIILYKILHSIFRIKMNLSN
jgi:hypothetical protein